MNTRLKQLQDNKLIVTITELEAAAQAQKGASQFTGGASVVFSVSTNAGAYDWTGTISPGSSNARFFLVAMTGAPGTVLYGNLSVAVSVNGFSSRYTDADYANDLVALDEGGSLGPVETNIWNVPNTSSQGANVSQGQVEVQVAGITARTVWIKLYAYALQPVTITVTPL